ncbi:MAG: hypothetical protein LBL66_08265, partial [Clostridiales bacterium]|nr:hypothetical protein [Clostridiales bacterium]
GNFDKNFDSSVATIFNFYLCLPQKFIAIPSAFSFRTGLLKNFGCRRKKRLEWLCVSCPPAGLPYGGSTLTFNFPFSTFNFSGGLYEL